MVKKLSLEVFKSIYAKVPRLAVDLVIQNKDGILLTLRAIEPKGYWHLPGGTVLFDETIEEAVKRIAKEELGLKVKVRKMLGVIDFYKSFNVYGHAVSIAYSVEAVKGDICLNNQASEAHFFKEIPKNTIDIQKTFLKTLLSNI